MQKRTRRRGEQGQQLLDAYTKKLEPLVEDAKRAYGARTQNTPRHRASRQYTRLVREYYERGGSLQLLAERLGVTYAGLRRRVTTADATIPVRPRRRSLTPEQLAESVSRVSDARTRSTDRYHAQVAKEWSSGVPLAALARGLGISGAGPLYYALSCHYRRSGAGALR